MAVSLLVSRRLVWVVGCLLALTALLLTLWLVLPPAALPAGSAGGGAAAAGVPTFGAMDAFTLPEQQHTLRFLRGLAAALPDLAPTWTGENYCSWAEIHCRGGGVTVDLSELQMTNTSAAPACLPELSSDVDGSLVAVTHVYLYHQGTPLQCSLPSTWGRLSRLVALLLMDNALSGTLPEAWGTGGAMASLQSVMLSLNALSGTLPASWSGLRGVKTLTVAGNALVGPLPPSWGDMPVLFLTDVSGNRLCGCVPRSWQTNKVLRHAADEAVVADNCPTANACP